MYIKKNNDSPYYKDWTTKKLKHEAISYYEMIYRVECYSVRDMITYSGIISELNERGIEPRNELVF
jgi:hypothetical protein